MIGEDLSAAGLEIVEFHGFPNHLEELLKDEDILEGAKDLSREALPRARATDPAHRLSLLRAACPGPRRPLIGRS